MEATEHLDVDARGSSSRARTRTSRNRRRRHVPSEARELQQAREWVQKNPEGAMAASFAVGIVIGMLMRD